MNINIKEIEIVLENLETISIKSKCIKELDYEVVDSRIETLRCLIEDDGSSEYLPILMNNKISPIQRLAEYNDISYIKINYEDDRSEIFNIVWNDEDLENNKNQKSELLSYREVYIKIEPCIESK